MKGLRKEILYGAVVFLAAVGAFSVPTDAQDSRVEARISVGVGSHFWYEIKADPESPKNLIICGTKWDALRNAALGIVYASWDGGTSWKIVLEDRNSSWVTEHSCAFGPNHKVYFISEASDVIDGHPRPDRGTTRLYVSTDEGHDWMETLKTGWADYSTAAVSLPSGKLYTFFNANTSDVARKRGASVGLLVFSPDGKEVAGPFLKSEMKDLGYEGIYPSGAIALQSGAVAAMYWGTRLTPAGRAADLGIIRADQAPEPSLVYTAISHTPLGQSCLNFDEGSLAYDPERNRLYALYVDGCKDTRIMLTSSQDEGATWAKSAVVADPQNSNRRMANPSLVVQPGGILGLLWQEGQTSGRWFFSQIRDQKLGETTIELSHREENQKLNNDSLATVIYEPNEPRSADGNTTSEPSITLNVRTELGVLRAIGLIATDKRVRAVYPSTDGDRMRLDFDVLGPTSSASQDKNSSDDKDADPDVTQQTVILYGGMQHFDNITNTLKVCLFLRNRGDKPIRVPIRLEAEDITSPLGSASILDSTNGLAGAGAIWDISSSVTGSQIPAGASSNSFCLSFRLTPSPESVGRRQGGNLLFVQMKVLASTNASSEHGKRSKN